MAANVGNMFYVGETPWHGLGQAMTRLLTLKEALKAGELNWEVEERDLMTAEDIPAPATHRKALVRTDRPKGDRGRVVGVVHRDFIPIQNRDGARIFDRLLGLGAAVYSTGGYLGFGEVVWLQAHLNRTFVVGKEDQIEPYALWVNSHDGSRAFTIGLTLVRVVCQNTLSQALEQGARHTMLRLAHKHDKYALADASEEFWQRVQHSLNLARVCYEGMATVKLSEKDARALVEQLLPLPKTMNAVPGSPQEKALHTRIQNIKEARQKILRLRHEGQGADLPSAKETYWGLLCAITEYVDHCQALTRGGFAYGVIGAGMQLKQRAQHMLEDAARKAA